MLQKLKSSSFRLFLFLLFLCTLLGCGGSNSESTVLNAGTKDATYNMGENAGYEVNLTPYRFQIQSIPNMNQNLAASLPAEGYIVDPSLYEELSFFHSINGTIYKSATVCIPSEDDEIIGGTYLNYIQYLMPPYTDWVDVFIPVSEDEWFQQATVTPLEQFLYLTSYWDGDQILYNIYELTREGLVTVLYSALTEEEKNTLWNGNPSRSFPDYYDFYSVAQDSQVATCSPSEGTLYFGSKQGVWYYDGTVPTKIVDFRANDIALQELICIQKTPDGFLFLGSFGGNYYLLYATYEEEAKPAQKEEIILADLYVSDLIKDAVASFNMQNESYRILIETPSITASAEKQESFKNDVTKALLKKEGPDILGEYVLDSDYIRYANHGYLLPMDDYFTGKEQDFFEGALSDHMANGHRYGIPYAMFLNYFMGDEQKLPNTDSWDVRELMDYVRDSRAKYVYFPQYGYQEGTGKLYTLMTLLNDPSDTTYIDWEQGISHLNEEPFKELLRFVEEYAYDGNMSFETAGAKLQEGEFALFSTSFSSMTQYQFQSLLYEDHPQYIGMPSVAGKGVSLSTSALYVNASTTKKEGIYAFFDYLLSNNGQMNCFTIQYPDQLPIRRETYEWMLDTNGDFNTHPNATYGYMNIQFKIKKLTDKQKKQAIELVEHSTPSNPKFREIMPLLKEELTPYFLGDRSIEEATEILHRRVQLYLSE